MLHLMLQAVVLSDLCGSVSYGWGEMENDAWANIVIFCCCCWCLLLHLICAFDREYIKNHMHNVSACFYCLSLDEEDIYILKPVRGVCVCVASALAAGVGHEKLFGGFFSCWDDDDGDGDGAVFVCCF